MGFLLQFALKNWKVVAIGFVFMAIAGYHTYRTIQISNLKETIAELKADLVTVQGNFDRCQETITTRNKEIEFWVEKGRAQKGQIDKLKGRIDVTKKQYDKAAVDILKENAPKDCKGAIEYLVKGKDDLQW